MTQDGGRPGFAATFQAIAVATADDSGGSRPDVDVVNGWILMQAIFFSNWESLLRTLVVGVLAYATLVAFLRISGNRTLSKMSAFDLIVTVSLGSTLATALLTKDVALADGALAFAVLIGLQFTVTWSAVRWRWMRRLVTGDPVMLVYRGRLLAAMLRRVRVTEEEVHAAVRAAGFASMAQVHAVVLETDGSFSVVRESKDGSSTMEDVARPEEARDPAA